MSPQVIARLGGLLYLYIIVAGLFVEVFVRSKLIVSGDAVATARNILSNESLWRSSFAAEMFMMVFAIVLTLILYILLRPVNAELALLSVLFNLVSLTIESMSALANFATLPLLHAHLPNASALFSLDLYEYGFGASLIFFGFVLLIDGFLVYNSGYFPKFLGVLLPIGGVCYLVNSFALFLSPPLSDAIFPLILLPAFVAELSFCLWLLVMGVNMDKWGTRRTNAGTHALFP